MGKPIFAILLFLLAGAVFFLYTQPTYSSVGDVQAQIAQYQQALDKAAQLQALKQQLLARYNAFNPTDISRLQTLLPDTVDNIGLILDLDSLASHYGMALENVDISTPQTATGGHGTIGASTQKYDGLMLHFGTYGTYDNFRSFLADLEHSLRLVDLVDLSIAHQGGPAAAGVAASYRYEMTIKTYWLK